MGNKIKNAGKRKNEIDVAWKQTIEHYNEFPSDLKGSDIDKVQPILKTYRHCGIKTDKIDELLKQKPKFEFCVFLKRKEYRNPAHVYVYDDKDTAENVQKHCLQLLINDQLSPYVEKVKSGKNLTLKDIDTCQEIKKQWYS